MMVTSFYLVTVILAVAVSYSVSQNALPENFRLGIATSAYQIEGGWNEGGKTISSWDTTTHSVPSLVADGTTGDIACDSYHKWEEDVRILKELGVHHYRFSIAWTRILSDTFSLNLNPVGVNYYNNLINALIENGIEPIITIYHWDQPQRLYYMGGPANEVWIDFYVNFARKAFELFGDRVKTWITFNEPGVSAFYVHLVQGMVRPEYPNGVVEYSTAKNILVAHAKAYRIYDREFRHRQKGRVGITLSLEWAEPVSESAEDIAAAERRRQFDFGIFANPIFNFDYPKVVTERVQERSRLENCSESRLKPLSLQEKLLVAGTADFIGLNYYSTWNVANTPEDELKNFGFEEDIRDERTQSIEWENTGSDGKPVVPWGLRKTLNWIKNTYRNPEIFITECGYSDASGTLEDDSRINFLKDHLNETIKALEDGVNISGFTVWSLMDNFEWTAGYTVKFGLYYVDFNDPERPRIPKKSVEYYQKVIATRNIE